jgi:hypothetical protein
MTAEQRRARLAEFGRRAGTGTTAVHRRAVLAGAPSRVPDPHRAARTRDGRRKASALVRELGFVGARIAKREGGRGVVTFAHPGAEGHERCKSVCVTYA